MYPGEIFGICLGISLLELITHLFTAEFFYQVFYIPLSIYKETRMNWFGTIIIYILIFPFSFILAIGGFLRWLFTVGRKK